MSMFIYIIVLIYIMTRTIALSEEAYKKLKELKNAVDMSYSDLILMLIKEYKEKRLHDLITMCEKLKIGEENAKKIENIIGELREREWW